MSLTHYLNSDIVLPTLLSLTTTIAGIAMTTELRHETFKEVIEYAYEVEESVEEYDKLHKRIKQTHTTAIIRITE